MEAALGVSTRVWLLSGALVGALILEALIPLRAATQSKLWRAAVNLALAALGAFALRLVFFPLVLAASSRACERGWGLVPRLGLRGWAASALALVLLDYTLYWWHIANHRWTLLWRFHGVHHADLDMDVTTASRFHPGELILSTGWRSAQAVLIGVDPFTLTLFETLVTLAAQFHHANIRLPFAFERALSRLIVTPRMHGIHHSLVQRETDSNFSTVLAVWDRLHGSLRLNVPQADITIGVPAYREPARVTFWRSLMVLPLENLPWRLPDGSQPERAQAATPLDALAA